MCWAEPLVDFAICLARYFLKSPSKRKTEGIPERGLRGAASPDQQQVLLFVEKKTNKLNSVPTRPHEVILFYFNYLLILGFMWPLKYNCNYLF